MFPDFQEASPHPTFTSQVAKFVLLSKRVSVPTNTLQKPDSECKDKGCKFLRPIDKRPILALKFLMNIFVLNYKWFYVNSFK